MTSTGTCKPSESEETDSSNFVSCTEGKTESTESKSPGSTANGSLSPHDTEPVEYASGWKLAVILFAVFANTFLAALDLGIIGTAIPDITDDFRQLDHVGWYGSAYFLTIGVFSPFWGKLYKYCHIKTVFLCTVGLFEIGSIIAATAPNSEVLIVGRAIQGWGAAGILGGGFLLVHHIAVPSKRPTYIGLLLAVFLCSSVLGPIIGGAFASAVTWRWCFYINLPIGGVSMSLVGFFFHTPKYVKPVPATVKEILLQLDFLGMILLMASLICFTLALQWGGQTHPWSSSTVIVLLVLWLVLSVTFGIVEHYVGERAMIATRLIKRRPTWSNSLYGFILNDPDWTLLYYLPIYFQSIQNLSAIDSGVANLPFLVMFSIGSFLGGSAVTRWRYVQPLATFGGVVCTIGGALIYTLDENSSRARYMCYQLVIGLGIGIGNQLPMTAVQGFSAPDDLASNTGIVLMAQLISGAYFLTASQSIFGNLMLRELLSTSKDIDPHLVLHTGATEIRRMFHGQQLENVLSAYMVGIKGAFVLALAGGAASAICSFLIPVEKLPIPPQTDGSSQEENQIVT